MTLEKPWAEEFNILLDKMVEKWGGTVVQPSTAKEKSRYYYPGFYIYPAYKVTLRDFPMQIDISEHSAGQARMIGAIDNVEFLNVSLITDTECDMLIRGEDFFDRFQKFIKLAREHETGDEEFDRRYFLDIKTEFDEKVLRKKKFRRTITTLEPFASIRIGRKATQWSQQIEDGRQLGFQEVQNYVMKLMNFMLAIKAHA